MVLLQSKSMARQFLIMWKLNRVQKISSNLYSMKISRFDQSLMDSISISSLKIRLMLLLSLFHHEIDQAMASCDLDKARGLMALISSL